MKTIVGITGTTAVGKSKVAVELAKKIHTEIISCDSMQVYREMNVGTAKITLEETCGIPHHMLDVVPPNCNFSAFDYTSAVDDVITQMDATPILVGGTGFYFDCLVRRPEFAECSPECKAKVKSLIENEGLERAVELLKELDEATCAMIDIKNPKRVARALEIALGGGKLSEGKGANREARYDLKLFVLQRNREELYRQIDKRVDEMLAVGLVEEAKSLYDKYQADLPTYSSFSAIGYKELFAYFNGEYDLDQAIAKIKQNTRNYAKRQISYFKRMNATKYIDVDGKTVEQIVDEICELMR